MIMTESDVVIGALCAWRENRSGGAEGMQSVINVLVNRAKARNTSIYTEAVRRLQFSSMTESGNPELVTFPAYSDDQWQTALAIMDKVADGTLTDITGGATSYYALSMAEPPYWAETMTETCVIAGQKFFKV